MGRRLILVRYGEIGLKGKNRPDFERRLLQRVRQALRGLPGLEATRLHGRILVGGRAGDAADRALEEAMERLGRVFGIVSFSPAWEVPLDMEAIAEAAAQAVRVAAERLRPGLPPGAGAGPTFKVDARRANKAFPLDSLEINRLVGAHVLRSVPGLKVDVHRPDLTLAVEVRDSAYIYTESIPGPGGLPVGTSGLAHLLLSGGIDSPVAGWMAMKRGLELEAVHFHSPPFTSERARAKVLDLARLLAGWGGLRSVHLVRFTEAQKAIYSLCPAPLGVTLMRRLMLRIAERISRERGGLALVTGESLGQVASQTLESIHVIERVAAWPVLRPLIGMDKEEIVALAKRIGTFDTSALPYEDCCTVFVPRHPRTRPRLDEVEEAESRLDVEALVQEALEATEVVEVEA